jgi:type I restriction enzyme M protein
MVPLAEITDPKNDFNLNLPRYIDSTEPEDLQDIDGHLRGGIPERDIDALADYWQVFPSVRRQLFSSFPSPRLRGQGEGQPGGYVQLSVSIDELKQTIFNHAEFTAFNDSITALFAKWRKASVPRLKGIAIGDKPKALIENLSEELLDTFRKARLLDAYDVYQHLMDYWEETMQDDVYMLVSDGWREAAKPRLVIDDKEKKTKEKPDFTVGKQKFKADLIPATLLIARYYAKEQPAIESLEAEAAALAQQLEEMAEEHGGLSACGGQAGEEGLLAEAKNEKDKLTKASVMARLKEIKGDAEFADERKVLKDYLALLEKEAEANDRVKDAQKELEAKVAAKYGKLTEDEIKTLVVDDKWLATVAAALQSELDRVSQALTGRIRQLAERYAAPLPQITTEVETLAARVDGHLKKMGAVWD